MKKNKDISKEIKQRAVGYITAAFGLVAGLAWNEAIKSLIEVLFPLDKNSLLAKFLYAILITVALVVVTLYITKLSKKDNETSS